MATVDKIEAAVKIHLISFPIDPLIGKVRLSKVMTFNSAGLQEDIEDQPFIEV